MNKRMLVALVALAGVFVALYLTMYKLGYIGTLACAIGSCEKVQTSKWATFLGMPVGMWGVGYYVFVLGMAIVGPHCYLAVAGSAYASRDPELIRRLWHPTYRAWFPDGKDDREATALRVVVDRVDYWEPPRSRFVRLFDAVKALATRRAVETPMKTIEGL